MASIAAMGRKLLQRFRRDRDPEPPEPPEPEEIPEEHPRYRQWLHSVRDRFSRSDDSEAATEATIDVEAERVDRELEAPTGKRAAIQKLFHKFASKANPEDIQNILDKLPRMKRGEIEKIWPKVEALAKMLRDPQAAWKSKALAIGALIYLISPLDAVPDIIPVVGLADDAALIIAVASALAYELDRYVKKTTQRGIEAAQQRADIEIRKYNQIVRVTLLGGIGFALLTILVNYILKHM